MDGKSNPASTVSVAEKNGYAHFMLKEIFEQPDALQRTITALLDSQGRSVAPREWERLEWARLERIVIVGMGTARHAGLVGKHAFQQLAGIPVEVEWSSEFRDGDWLLPAETLIIAISQSGETGDTLAAVREARRQGVRVLGLTNVEGSTLAREADVVVQTQAGPERAVPSTKAYVAQLAALYGVAAYVGRVRQRLDADAFRWWRAQLDALPRAVERVLEGHGHCQRAAQRLAQREQAFFIGRHVDLATAAEGALKLKEVSYIHAEAYTAGEFKHGSVALLREGDPVLAVATQPGSAQRMEANVRDVVARGAWAWVVAAPSLETSPNRVWEEFRLPHVAPLLAPVVSVVPLQLLAYHTALLRGCEIDSPRNLTKSITVE